MLGHSPISKMSFAREQTVMWLAFLMLAFVIGVAAGYAVRLA
jgi:hypothetical protein